MPNCEICGKPVTTGVVVHRECMPRWIPLTERLPREDKKVLVCYYFGNHTEMRFVGTLDYYAFDPEPHFQRVCDKLHVTHWMPLPEPPKEGEL